MKHKTAYLADNKIMNSLKPFIISLTVGILTNAVLLLLSSLVISAIDMPHRAILLLSIFISAFSAFVSGFVLVKIMKGKALIYGALAGLLLFIAAFFTETVIMMGDIKVLAFYKCIIYIISSSIGGIFAVNNRKKLK